MKNRIYIHYGANAFDEDKMTEVTSDTKIHSGSKPFRAGLWASPVECSGWEKWCTAEDFRIESFQKSFVFSLREGSRVLIIDSVEDFRANSKLVSVLSWTELQLDFGSIIKEYDAILLTEKGMRETRDIEDAGLGMYGWDCESIVVFRADSIVPGGGECLG